MRMETRLYARQEMRMKLAPQIYQSLEILQLPLLELKEHIDQELLENPMLEQVESEDSPEEQQTAALEGSEVEAPKAEPVEEVTIDVVNDAEQFERLADLTQYYEDFNSERSPRSYSAGERDAKMEAFENSPAPDPPLEEHLQRQLPYRDLSDTVRLVCENIVANLDYRGYLAHPLEEIVASMDVEVSEEEAEEALAIVQGLEPPGVGARTIEECLTIQLDEREPDYEFLRRLINAHFQDILQNRYPMIAQAMGCSVDDLKAAVDKIGKLEPFPGTLFKNPAAPHVIPDLRVEDVDGTFTVITEDTWLPSLRICAYYARRLQQKDLDDKTRDYLRKRLQSAAGLISAIEQRRSTVFNGR